METHLTIHFSAFLNTLEYVSFHFEVSNDSFMGFWEREIAWDSEFLGTVTKSRFKIEKADVFTPLSIFSGLDTGFYLTPIRGRSLLVRFRLGTGNNPLERNRDPINITIEGSNNDNLNKGTSWTLIYDGTSGLKDTTSRSRYGDFVDIQNTISYASYRFLVTAKRGVDMSVEYSEVEFYDFYNPNTSTTQIPSTIGKYWMSYPF